jgi:hypothetical protein
MFDDEFIAAVERDKYLIENNLVNGYRKLNFPELLENQTV